MNLKHLTDRTLLDDTKRLAQAERELTVKVLHHLWEIDRRKLFSDLGFTSLYDYCVKELGYSEASAHRRIVASRLLGEIPTLEQKIESGLLNLTNVACLTQFFREHDIADVKKKEEIAAQVEGLSKRECELKLMQLSDRPFEKKHCLWLRESTMAKIRNYRELKGTRETVDETISEVITRALAELGRTRFKLVKRPLSNSTSESRIPTASVKREVFLRDKQCVKCGSKFGLQFDHRHPYSLGGKSTPDNLRLLCHNCNQRERIRQRL